MTNKRCICGSGKISEKCCERFIKMGLNARTPEQLMRSRYSAYAMGGYGHYLLQTWFPATAQGLTEKELSERGRDWVKLEIIDRSQKGNEGMVEFNAYYRDEKGELNVMHEKSVFQRIQGRWYYVGGEIAYD